VGEGVDLSDGYLVVMQHPVTTEYDLARAQIWETLYAVRTIGMPALWFWPNVDAGSDGTSGGLRTFREQEKPNNFQFFKNMAPDDFLRLLYNSSCLVGNSSVGIRECSFLGIPAVNIGSRQQGRDRGANLVDVDYDRRQIQRAIERHLSNGRYPQDTLYGDGRAGGRIAGVLSGAPLCISKQLTY
jgi:UDP-N-acetylglucosamine 2-epimerase